MSVTLAFDVYGTLIDTHAVVSKLEELIGDKAAEFSQTWRDKQLEYSFRRGLMRQYQTFAICTMHALEYTCSYYKVSLAPEQKDQLLNCYKTLAAFKDVKDGLRRLKVANYKLYAFSNGTAEAVENLLEAAGIRDLFDGVVSVDDIKTFKPDPAVYSHLLHKTAALASNTWLISSNPFDVIGAISCGIRAAWVQRSKDAIFDPWGVEPTIVVDSLEQLQQKIGEP
ncbi:MAG: haloacid dehalogenase type II [Oceanospirillaceae bacterium]|nr:haloacid dehalogenase type II [Oceanospirillaceae bacterium]